MKDEINLLPQEAQHFRLSQLYFYRIGQMIRRVDIILLIILLVMGVIYGSILSLAQYSVRTAPQSAQTTEDYTQQITQTNDLLHFVNQQNSLRVSWMSQVAQIITIVPPGIRLQSVAVAEGTSTLVIEGSFDNRATLVAFENGIRALSWVATIESPLSNFATGVTTGFTLKVNRKPL